MEEPRTLAAAIAERLATIEPGSRAHQIRLDILAAVRIAAARRRGVLRHPDLAARFCQPPLSYKHPGQWNGWIPPAIINVGDIELCRSPAGRGNQLGHYASGERPNDSPQRAALIEIATEAWARRNDSLPVTRDITQLSPLGLHIHQVTEDHDHDTDSPHLCRTPRSGAETVDRCLEVLALDQFPGRPIKPLIPRIFSPVQRRGYLVYALGHVTRRPSRSRRSARPRLQTAGTGGGPPVSAPT